MSASAGRRCQFQLRDCQPTSTLWLIMRSSTKERKPKSLALARMARSEVLLKPNVAYILLFNFCEQHFFNFEGKTVTRCICTFCNITTTYSYLSNQTGAKCYHSRNA